MAQEVSIARQILLVVLTGLVLLALWAAKSVLIPIAFAILLAFILTPVVALLQRRGLGRVGAVLVVMIVGMTAAVGIGAGLTSQLHSLVADLPKHKDRITDKLRTVLGSGPGLMEKLTGLFDEISHDLQTARDRDNEQEVQKVIIQPEKISGMSLFPRLAGPVVGALGSISLMIALTVSILLKREDLRDRLLRLAGHGQLTSTTRAVDEGTKRISRYLVMQVLINSCFGLVFGIGLALIGLPHALLWGFLAAVLRFIPYIGTWLAAAFPLLLSVAVFDGWTQPLLVVGFVVLSGVLTNNVVEPLYISRSTGVSPVALITAAAFWTWLWGPIGLVLSTPLTVCVGLLGKYVPSLWYLDVLLGTAPALAPQFTYYQRLLARDEAEASVVLEGYMQTHTHEEVLDTILLPTLSRARGDLEQGHLSREHLQYILRVSRELGRELIPQPEQPVTSEAPILLCCALHDEVDDLAGELFGLCLEAEGCSVRHCTSQTVSSDILARVSADRPAAVCVVAVPPGGVTQGRYLCKRLRGRFSSLPVLVGRWGDADDESEQEVLRSAGASLVGSTVQQTRQQVLPILKVAVHLQAAPDETTMVIAGPLTALPAGKK